MVSNTIQCRFESDPGYGSIRSRFMWRAVRIRPGVLAALVVGGHVDFERVADAVHAQRVGRPRDTWWTAGHDDDELALLATFEVEQRPVDLLDHLVRVRDGRDQKRLDTPREGELAAGRRVGGEGKQGNRGPVPRQPPSAVAGLGKRHEITSAQVVANLNRGMPNRTAGRAFLADDAGNGGEGLVLNRADDARHRRNRE